MRQAIASEQYVLMIARAWLNRPLAGLLWLLMCSAATAAGLTLLASHQWQPLDIHSTTELLLILQWQIAGVLLSKGGIDQALFAEVSKRPEMRMSAQTALVRLTLPGAVMFSCFVGIWFSLDIAVVLFCTVVLDVCSLIASADLNARGRHFMASLGLLLNYPLFLALIWLAAALMQLNTHSALLLYLVSSAARCTCLGSATLHLFKFQPEVLRPGAAIASHPMLNHLLFRSDQMLLAVFVAWNAFDITAEFAARFLFLAKFAEIIAGVVVYVGLVYFPRLQVEQPLNFKSAWSLIRRHRHVATAGALLTFAAGGAYTALYAQGDIAWPSILPFAVHAVLALPAYLLTYMTFRQKAVHILVQNICIALCIGFAGIVAIVAVQAWEALAWVVPIQLMAFLAVGLIRRSPLV